MAGRGRHSTVDHNTKITCAANDADGRREHWDTPDVDLIDLVLVSHHITCVLDKLRRSWLELVHAPTSATHPARRSTASAASSTDVVTQT